MDKIFYYFYIMVLRDGERIPWVKMHDNDNSVLIEELFTAEFRKSKNVFNLISQVENIQAKEFVYHSNIELHIDKEIVRIEEDSMLSRRYILSTERFLFILKDWYSFLKAYENGQIPNVISEYSKDELVIVPKVFVKDDYDV